MIPLRKKAKPEEQSRTMTDYRNGAEGFIAWCEDFVCIPIYPEGSVIPEYIPVKDLPSEVNPETGRSYKDIWEGQKEVVRKALIMQNGRFIYRLIIFCWMRGEGKSLLACLVQLWKFFCWPKQEIMLGANSKDQVKFVHYDIMRDIIFNSPKLLAIVGKRNIQEKEIRLKDGFGNVRSRIRSISSFSGIVSNITGFTFSEIFDMKNPKFFVQLYGSIRNIPNAFGIIDSTVSSKQHILYHQYQNWLSKKSKALFFSYRFSKNGDHNDYWNPMMTTAQLEDYRASFPFGEYERYFLNLWEAGQVQPFTDDMIAEMGCIAYDGQLFDHPSMHTALLRKEELVERIPYLQKHNLGSGIDETEAMITEIDRRFTPVTQYYNMAGRKLCSLETLQSIGDMLETDWSVLAGADVADPMALRSSARTIFTCIAKGLPGSKNNPYLMTLETTVLKFVYIMLHFVNVEKHDVGQIKTELELCNDEYAGVDVFCGERYGLWDMQGWCDDRDIEFIPVYPNYARQKDAFKAFYDAMKEGRFKSPPIDVPGSKKEDIFREELAVFQHETKYGPTGGESGWFGSPEKAEKYGIQDDTIFSIGWTMYGGKEKGPADFRIRKSLVNFGVMYQNRELLGSY